MNQIFLISDYLHFCKLKYFYQSSCLQKNVRMEEPVKKVTKVKKKKNAVSIFSLSNQVIRNS